MPLFTRPVGTKYRMSSPYGQRLNEFHEGVDWATPVGTPVLASASGTVTIAEIYGGYGNLVQINHEDKWSSRYGHLSLIGVHIGQFVQRGDVIGKTGGVAGLAISGHSTGPHIHFELRKTGRSTDPIPLLETLDFASTILTKITMEEQEYGMITLISDTESSRWAVMFANGTHVVLHSDAQRRCYEKIVAAQKVPIVKMTGEEFDSIGLAD